MTMDNPETKIMRHAEVYSGKIVALHVDTIQLPSGKNAIREVVVHPGGVVAVPVVRVFPQRVAVVGEDDE